MPGQRRLTLVFFSFQRHMEQALSIGTSSDRSKIRADDDGEATRREAHFREAEKRRARMMMRSRSPEDREFVSIFSKKDLFPSYSQFVLFSASYGSSPLDEQLDQDPIPFY